MVASPKEDGAGGSSQASTVQPSGTETFASKPPSPCRQLSAGYFLLFAGFGVVYPYLPLFLYRHARLTPAQIGVFSLVQQATRAGATPALGHLAGDECADHRQAHCGQEQEHAKTRTARR